MRSAHVRYIHTAWYNYNVIYNLRSHWGNIIYGTALFQMILSQFERHVSCLKYLYILHL